MRLKLSTHFTLLILLVGALTLLQDPRVGAAYLIASAAILVPLSMWRVPRRYFYVVLFSAVAIWLTHFLRVPFLLALPESARFPRVVILTPALGVRVLLQIALYSLLLLLGLVMGLRAFAGRTPVRSEVEKHGRRPYLLHASIVVLVLCVGLLMIRVLFQLGLGLNTKFVVNPSTGFLSRILPDHLIYPVALLYLVKYRRHISSFETSLFALVVVGFSILVTLSGSRQAFAAIGLALFIYYLAHRGNFRLGAMKAWLLGVMAAWMLILTFAIAAPLRSYLKTERGYGQQVAAVMVAGARAAINPRSLMLLGGLVSKRISGGFDGLVAVNQEQPEIVKDAFSLRRTVLIVLAKLIPRYGVEEEMVTGKAIAVAYGGVSLDQRQASAVGLFAALQLMFGPRLSYVAALGLGLLWAGYFRVTERFRDPDVTFLFHFIGMQQLIIWVMSGNFDIVIPGTIRSLVYLVVYGGLVVVTATVARGRGRRPDAIPSRAQPSRIPAT